LRDYRTSHAAINTLVAPELPTLTWSYDQRAARFGALNRQGWSDGSGMKRRHRRELSTQSALRWRGELLAGELHIVGRDRLRRSWRELMHAHVIGRAPALYDLRAKIGRLLDQVVKHGPASGWGVEDPHFGTPGHRHVRYIVPKASEKCWRWWRARARELRRLVLLLDRLYETLVPAHQQGSSRTPTEDTKQASSLRSEHLGQEWRDRSLASVRALLTQLSLPKGA
jgi:hypothetical protein